MAALTCENFDTSNTSLHRATTCDDEWLQFCSNNYTYESAEPEKPGNNIDDENLQVSKSKNVDFIDLKTTNNSIPKSTELYISTKTKIGYFEKELDIANIFWKIDVIPYQQISKGIIKKQMKIATNDEKYIAFVDSVVASTPNCELLDLSKGKNKYVKKISIGTSKKDLISYRTKKKSAFYNCFVLYFRIHTDEGFKEMHVKIFNTGKIEIPGIKNDYLMNIVLSEIDELFNVKLGLNNSIKRETFTTVLINSNFNCGYYVNREKLVDILKGKYCLSTSYDPCSYPGIMSKFYYNKDIESVENINVNYVNQAHTEGSNVLSFMIFRTGSILIVGKCNETILYKIYHFIKNILGTEYENVSQNISNLQNEENQKKNEPPIKKKIKKTHILVNC
jgi:predicted Fe-Mo cluster-binding NifX family protein